MVFQGRVELLPPDIDGVDFGCAALDKDIRKPARGRANIKAYAAFGIDAKMRQRVGEL